MKNIISIIVSVLLCLAGSASAQEHFLEIIKAEQNQKSIARGETIPGVVVNEDKDVKVGRKLYVGDRVSVPKDVRVTFESSNRNTIETKSNAEFIVNNITNKGEAYYQLFGKIRYIVIPKAVEFFNVYHTKYLAAVEGTVFVVNVDLENKEIECTAEQGQVVVISEYKIKVADKEVNGLRDIKALYNQEGKRLLKSKLNAEQASKEFRNYEEALFYFTEQLKVAEQIEEKNHVILTKNNIGLIHHAFAHDNEAIAIFKDAYKDSIISNKELLLSIISNNIGMILSSKELYDSFSVRDVWAYKAPMKITDFNTDKTLIIEENVLDIEPNILSYQYLSEMGYLNGDYDKAIEFYTQALMSGEKIFGKEHPIIAIYYNNLGLVWRKKGKYDKSVELYQSALIIDEKIYGNQHPKIAKDYSNIGGAWYLKGDYDKAIYSYQQALLIDENFFGEKHSQIAIRYNNLGSAWKEKGKYNTIIGNSNALYYYEKAFKIALIFLGKDHPITEIIWKNLITVGGIDMFIRLKQEEKVLER